MTRGVIRLDERTTLAVSTTGLQLAFAAVVALLLAAHLAAPLRVVYPIAAVLIALRLQRLSVASYVAFTIWLWFLTPLVRRIADAYGGFQEPSYILLAPYLATGVSAVGLIAPFMRRSQRPPKMAGVTMFALAGVGAGIGVPLGLLTAGSAALLEILNWFVPLFFGWYLATRFDQLHEIERQVIATFKRAGLVAGAYGIYQFSVLPSWDVSWMQNVEMASIGLPEPFAVRVFSTMHAPGVLGFFLMLAVLLWVAKPFSAGIPGAAMAGAALLLSQVRSAWLAFAVAALLVVASLKPAQQLRTAVLLAVAALAMGTFILTPQMSELLGSRMATMERLTEDESALSRLDGHAAALDFVAGHPLGAGIGHSDPGVDALISMRDSVIVAVLVQFGVVGSLLYLFGLLVLFTQLWRYYRRGSSADGVALAAGAIGILSTAWLGVVNAGPIGVCLWMIGGLATADRHLARLRMAAVQAQALRLRQLADSQRLAG